MNNKNTFDSTQPTVQGYSTGGFSSNSYRFSRTVIASAVAVVLLTACSDNDDDTDSGSSDNTNTDAGENGTPVSGNFAVSQNDGVTPGNVQFFTGGLDSAPVMINTGANEGIAFDSAGTLYQNSDSDSVMGIRVIGQASSLAAMTEFNPGSDRTIGSFPGKGLTYVPAGDLLVSGDVTDEAADMKIFAASAGIDASPLFVVDTPAPVWDVFYQEDTDRLYAALTNGVLAVFDDFSSEPGAAPDRLITPVDDDGAQVSVNLHGVFVEDGVLLVTDVGSADSPTDGALFTFADDGTLDGETTAFTMIAGPATQLGNPVDAILDGGSAVVAEKSNDQLLTFNSINSLSGDVAPSASTIFSKPESIEFTIEADANVIDASDIDTPTTLDSILIALNPGPVQDDGSGTIDNSDVGVVSLIGADLATIGAFNAGELTGDPGAQSFRTLENVQIDSAGNTFAVFDETNGTDVSASGLVVLHQIESRVDGSFDADRDRVISGPMAGLTSPKGVEIVESLGMMIVADQGNDGTPATLQIYSTAAGDDVAPVFTVSNTGDAAIWDVDYDPISDTLYAAGTAGDLLVYDDFFASGASATPTRSIQPSTAEAPSNLHGIVHNAATDQVILTDVGDAASAEDGKLYVLDAASSAEGSVEPRVTISGPDSTMGNPVDLAFDGSAAYIAEKSNDALLIYNDVLSLTGDLTQAPDQSIPVNKPESVSLDASDGS